MRLVTSIILIGFLTACQSVGTRLPTAGEMPPEEATIPKPQKRAEAAPEPTPAPRVPAPAPRRKSHHAHGSAPAVVSESAPEPGSEGVGPRILPGTPQGYQEVRVFFATDRNQTGSNVPKQAFGVDRGDFSYGTCLVSIPLDHRVGELESPSIWKFEFSEVAAKHVVLLSITVQPKDEYFKNLAASIRSSKKASAFLFVHGYNTSFEDAGRRTAQMAYDLQFEGAPVFYSWPSQGSEIGYTVDEQNIEWAEANLRGFLKDFFTRSDAQNIYLIAHSMGNRALTGALASVLTEQPALRKRLKEVILAAPDIDAEVFKRDIAPRLAQSGQPITLYASSLDRALRASKKVHGYRRAGDSGGALVIFPGIETIDATGKDTSFLGHSYFASTSSILGDIHNIIGSGLRAAKRSGLTKVKIKEGLYWKFNEM